ncbi:MAG: hypothetical protein VYC42_15395 [Pseudomonadota bacterium]|nr:hypothetical protein [Pseudomonadota bacterium]
MELTQTSCWLLHCLDTEDPARPLAGLIALSAPDTEFRSFRGRTDLAPLLAALATQRPTPQPEVEQLRAVLILAAFHCGAKGAPRRRHMKTLASYIRGADRSRLQTARTLALEVIEDAKNPAEIGTRLAAAWAHDDADVCTDWQRVWAPWLIRQSDFTANPSDEPLPPGPPIHLPLGGEDLGFGPEPPTTTGLPVEFDPPTEAPSSTRPPRRPFEATFSHQAVRGSNRMLIKEHVACANDAEVAAIVRHVFALYESRRADAEVLALGALLLLQVVTGRVLRALADTQFHCSDESNSLHLRLDLKAGVLIQPVLPIPQRFVPMGSAIDSYQPIGTEIRLPLPPRLVELLRFIHGIKGGARIADWFGADLDLRVRAFVLSVPGLPRFGRGEARLRKWLAPQLESIGGDVAKTMLICGDTLGRSTAPLYYYSTLHHDLAELYRLAVWPMLGGNPATVATAVGSNDRVGPAALAKLDTARRGVISLGRRLNESAAAVLAAGPARVREYHNRFTDYVLHHSTVVSSNRPEKSVFTRTIDSYERYRHLNLLEDKPLDLAHLTRLSCSTPDLSMQAQYYLGHLRVLREQAWLSEDDRRWIDDIEAGRRPLLVYLDGDNRLREGKADDWRASRPEAWSLLEDNWYRAFAATTLRELGAPAIAVFAHLGHLEAANFPFGSESPVVPTELFGALRPHLVQMERMLGFRVLKGFAETRTEPSLGQLRDWSDTIKGHEAAARRAKIADRQVLRANRKQHRVKAIDWLNKTISEICSPLAEAVAWLQQDRRGKPEAGAPTGLVIENASIDTILRRLDSELGDERTLVIAAHNQLCRWLRSGASRLNMKVRDIGTFTVAPRPELAPFVPGACRASMQVVRLRQHLSELFRQSPGVPQPVLRALAATLFGGACDPDIVLQLVGPQINVGSVPGGVLLSDERNDFVLGFSGYAALAFRGPLAASDTYISASSLSLELASYLPSDLVPADRSRTLTYLCSTVCVVSRIERSGLARFIASDLGAIDASAGDQAAFLSAAFANRRESDPEIVEPAIPVWSPPPDFSKRKQRAATHAVQSLKRLQKVVFDPQTLIDRRSGAEGLGAQRAHKRAKHKQHAPTRALMLQALDMFFPKQTPDGPIWIEDALATHVRDLIEEGTQLKKDPAASTIRTYLGSIGADLVDLFDSFDLRELDADDFEEAYRFILASKEKAVSVSRTATQLIEFHRSLARHYGFEEPDMGWFRGYLAKRSGPRKRIGMLSDAEYACALGWLRSQCDPKAEHGLELCGWRRTCMAAACALILLRRSGGRIGEISWLQFRDVGDVDGQLLILIRPSRFRTLKTAAARRVVDLTHRIRPDERALLMVWLHGEQARAGSSESALVFTDIGSGLGLGDGFLRRMIQLAFATSCGRVMHPHLLRHLWICDEMVRVARDMTLTRDPLRRYRSMKSVSVQAGHTLISTSFASYVHFSWLFADHESEPLAEGTSRRWLMRGLAELGVYNVDKIGQRAKSEDNAPLRELHWLRAVQANVQPHPVSLRYAAEGRPCSSAIPSRTLTIRDLDVALNPECVSRLETVCVTAGMSEPLIARLRDAVHLLAETIHYRLLPMRSRRGNVAADRSPRAAPCLDFDRVSPKLAHVLGALFRQTYTPTQARWHRFAGSEHSVRELGSALAQAGVPLNSLRITAGDASCYLTLIAGAGKRVSGFRHLARMLALVSVWSQLTNPDFESSPA